MQLPALLWCSGAVLLCHRSVAEAGATPATPESYPSARHVLFHQSRALPPRPLTLRRTLQIRCGGNAFDWCTNIGTPAALVGGAALANAIELEDRMEPSPTDTKAHKVAK